MERTGLQSLVALPSPLLSPLPAAPPRSKWTLPSLPVCPCLSLLSARPLAFLSTLNLSSRFWMYCGPDLWLYIPSQVSGQLLKQGTQGSPQTEPWTCWSAHCGTSPSCEAPQEAGSSTAVDC